MLGQPGAFGTVYRGVDGTLGLRFAVKRLDPHAPWAPECSAQAEIAMLSRFRHDNIIRLWGFCDDPQGHCLVYELGVRGALSNNLVDDAKAAELTWKTRIRIARGIASALSYLHRSDPPAWHRDVKAANVVLTASLTPKLIDCGRGGMPRGDGHGRRRLRHARLHVPRLREAPPLRRGV
jgi:serine/threonine protein kinase